MRVLLTSGIFPPEIGGPATYVPRFARGLTDHGDEAVVVTTAPGPDEMYRFEQAWVTAVSRQRALPLRMARLAAEAAREARHVDLVYANGSYLEAAVAARVVRRPLVMKVVGDVAWERAFNAQATTLDLVGFRAGRLPRESWIDDLLQRWWVRRADKVIVGSTFLGSLVRDWGVPADKIAVLPNATDSAVPRRACTPPTRSKRIRVVTSGRLVRWKGVETVIEAVDRVGADLTIVGDGPELENLRRTARECGDEARVSFTGALPASTARELFAEHDVFALNSSSETFSYVTIEAMAAGLPVVVADSGALPEVVDAGRHGLVCQRDDVEAWAAAFERLHADADLYSALQQAGLEAVSTKYSWPSVFSSTRRLLDEVARS